MSTTHATPSSLWRPTTVGIGVAALAMIALGYAGCRSGEQDRSARSSQSARQRQINSSNTLLNAVTLQLRDLPARVPLDLSPPIVVLDATTSRDRRDVMATVGLTPGSEVPVANFLTVPTGNADFRRLDIEPGDIIKAFLVPDAATRERLRETGELDPNILTHDAVEMKVTQVVGPNAVRIEDRLRIPVRVARELGARLDNQMLAEAGLPPDFIRQLVAKLDAAGAVTQNGVPLPPELIQILPGVAWPFRIEVWRVVDDRMVEINNRLARYANRGEPRRGWEPSPDLRALTQITEQLNQWLRSREPADNWRPPLIVQSLGDDLRGDESLVEYYSDDALASRQFAPAEGRLIQEAIWLRDAGVWAGGGGFDPIERATKLFDWAVRNVTLSTDPRMIANRPWQSLIYGRGAAEQRAWVFAEACRQQRLDVVVLEVPREGEVPPWLLCGLLTEGSLYLFDPQLGLPLPGPDGGPIATLAQIQADDALLRSLDLPDSVYPVTAANASEAVANLVADDFSLSWRAAELQQQFSAEDALALGIDADGLAEEVAGLASVKQVRLWPTPALLLKRQLRLGENTRKAVAVEFQPFAWRPRLWKARVLHLRGILESEEEAKRRNDALYEAVNDHQAAGRLYMSRSVRPPNDRLAQITKLKRGIYTRCKATATYWVGLLQYELGEYESALARLDEAEEDEGNARRVDGVRYNRARTLEALGRIDEAAEILEASQSPQRHGDRLRAKWLRPAETDAAEPAASETASADASSDADDSE
ncbi:MAG: CDC27 family protein [Planctomycetota bacterium]